MAIPSSLPFMGRVDRAQRGTGGGRFPTLSGKSARHPLRPPSAATSPIKGEEELCFGFGESAQKLRSSRRKPGPRLFVFP